MLKFDGPILRQLVNTCQQHNVELPTRNVFYGTCISRSHRGTVDTLIWALKTNTYKIKIQAKPVS